MSGLTLKSPAVLRTSKSISVLLSSAPPRISRHHCLAKFLKMMSHFQNQSWKGSARFMETHLYFAVKWPLKKSFALSAQYLGRLDICGGNIRAFHILSVGGYLVAWALNCSPSHDLPCVCAELTHTWFPSQHHANTYNLTLSTTR